MTNNTPKWENELNEMADHNQMVFIDKTFLKVFIQKVHDEAYERGYNQGKESEKLRASSIPMGK